jgi:hypothetical protein
MMRYDERTAAILERWKTIGWTAKQRGGTRAEEVGNHRLEAI